MVDVRVPEMDMYLGRGQQHLDDDGAGSSVGNADDKEKGRGSYKCGRVSEIGRACILYNRRAIYLYAGSATHFEFFS